MSSLTPNSITTDANTIHEAFSSVEDAIAAMARGEMVIVADDEDRENEGDFVFAAEKVTPDLINIMATHGRGLICLTLSPELCDKLNLFPMVHDNTDPLKTAFTVSIDAETSFGVTTGISTYDRAKTIEVAIANDAQPADLRRPGHIFPLRAKPGGVLERVGQTEASVDLARLTGLKSAGVICEILKPDGTMARRAELHALAREFNMPFITVAQLIDYRLKNECLVERVATATLPTTFGDFEVMAYVNTLDQSEHLALVMGDVSTNDGIPPLVRVHSECLTGDILGSLRCDCGFQLHGALQQIADHGKGVLVYMRKHEGRGIGLANKIRAYALQDKGRDTVQANLDMGFEPDLRHYGIGAQILRNLGVTQFSLLTNNPRKVKGLEGYGLQLVDRVPLVNGTTEQNAFYLATKRDKLGHLFSEALGI